MQAYRAEIDKTFESSYVHTTLSGRQSSPNPVSLIQTGSASARDTRVAQFKNPLGYANSSKEELSYVNTDRTSKTPDSNRSQQIIASLAASVEQLKPGTAMTQ